MLERTKRVLLGTVLAAMAGCTASTGSSLNLAGNPRYCPTGTVLVCTSLYEPERELAPSCGCADLMGRR